MADIPAPPGIWAVYDRHEQDESTTSPRRRVMFFDHTQSGTFSYVTDESTKTVVRADQVPGGDILSGLLHDDDFANCTPENHPEGSPQAQIDQTGYDYVCGGVIRPATIT